ncbi:cytochrome P450 [Herpetosiphon giganteus]|nr:cytochrome P450 [Herpetosiphon giganteus]
MSFMQSLLNPYPWFKTMREQNPVYFDQTLGSWVVFRYADVKQVMTDYEHFSSAPPDRGDGMNMFANSMLMTDPPRHRQLRSLVNLAFTPRMIEQLHERIDGLVNGLLDDMLAQSEPDFIRDFATPLPMTVIAEMLGVPTEDQDKFKYWTEQIITSSNNPNMAEIVPIYQEFGAYLYSMIEQRRAEPQADLISDLLKAQIDGESLSDMDLIGFCALLLVAGNETTTNLLGNAVRVFSEQPAIYAELRANPSLIPNVLDETLRYYSPVKAMPRHTHADQQIGDVTIPAGQRIMAVIGSANRDESQFPNADNFDLHRKGNQHIAFGHGIHYCLGAPLARLEGKLALEALIKRVETIAIKPDAQLEPIPTPITFGVKNLPVVITTNE